MFLGELANSTRTFAGSESRNDNLLKNPDWGFALVERRDGRVPKPGGGQEQRPASRVRGSAPKRGIVFDSSLVSHYKYKTPSSVCVEDRILARNSAKRRRVALNGHHGEYTGDDDRNPVRALCATAGCTGSGSVIAEDGLVCWACHDIREERLRVLHPLPDMAADPVDGFWFDQEEDIPVAHVCHCCMVVRACTNTNDCTCFDIEFQGSMFQACSPECAFNLHIIMSALNGSHGEVTEGDDFPATLGASKRPLVHLHGGVFKDVQEAVEWTAASQTSIAKVLAHNHSLVTEETDKSDTPCTCLHCSTLGVQHTHGLIKASVQRKEAALRRSNTQSRKSRPEGKRGVCTKVDCNCKHRHTFEQQSLFDAITQHLEAVHGCSVDYGEVVGHDYMAPAIDNIDDVDYDFGVADAPDDLDVNDVASDSGDLNASDGDSEHEDDDASISSDGGAASDPDDDVGSILLGSNPFHALLALEMGSLDADPDPSSPDSVGPALSGRVAPHKSAATWATSFEDVIAEHTAALAAPRRQKLPPLSASTGTKSTVKGTPLWSSDQPSVSTASVAQIKKIAPDVTAPRLVLDAETKALLLAVINRLEAQAIEDQPQVDIPMSQEEYHAIKNHGLQSLLPPADQFGFNSIDPSRLMTEAERGLYLRGLEDRCLAARVVHKPPPSANVPVYTVTTMPAYPAPVTHVAKYVHVPAHIPQVPPKPAMPRGPPPARPPVAVPYRFHGRGPCGCDYVLGVNDGQPDYDNGCICDICGVRISADLAFSCYVHMGDLCPPCLQALRFVPPVVAPAPVPVLPPPLIPAPPLAPLPVALAAGAGLAPGLFVAAPAVVAVAPAPLAHVLAPPVVVAPVVPAVPPPALPVVPAVVPRHLLLHARAGHPVWDMAPYQTLPPLIEKAVCKLERAQGLALYGPDGDWGSVRVPSVLDIVTENRVLFSNIAPFKTHGVGFFWTQKNIDHADARANSNQNRDVGHFIMDYLNGTYTAVADPLSALRDPEDPEFDFFLDVGVAENESGVGLFGDVRQRETYKQTRMASFLAELRYQSYYSGTVYPKLLRELEVSEIARRPAIGTDDKSRPYVANAVEQQIGLIDDNFWNTYGSQKVVIDTAIYFYQQLVFKAKRVNKSLVVNDPVIVPKALNVSAAAQTSNPSRGCSSGST